MGDSLDLPRIDPLAGHDPRDAVAGSRDRPPRKRRQPHPREQRGDDEAPDADEPRQVGSRLDVRA